MDDLISGHRLMSEIKPMVGIFAADDEFYISYNAVLNAIEYAPTIDAVPVVRCKDCKHRPIETGGHNYGQDLFFPDEDNVCPCQCGDQWYSWMPGDDWFCANGERRDIKHAESISLISAVAEPKRGKWKRDADGLVWCYECGFGKERSDERPYNYCPNCGAKMER